MGKKSSLFFMVSTAVSLMTLLSFSLMLYLNKGSKDFNLSEVDKGRNENSTPRSFILPSTAAVALLQEQKRALYENEFKIKKCILKLYDIGYTIANFEDIFDFQVTVALIDFQKQNGILPISGKLDNITVEKLGC